MSLSIWQVVLVALLFILLFGRGRIPALMGDLAQGIKSFKQGISENDDESVKPASETKPEVKIEKQ
ncbi:twin-arginine translocase TatA/TatE family subunit [Aliiglaciecola lipolytica]|uniref:Sec-independent protein translocase protein TatA n=1 Tax=Aliiglaciecola lipolytica E3 TaxID=1127673 RepID=K6Y8E8_9ALTE|nr:twin-arginine translocase TatA/TatE family subunit [Aliiglaciecola lipolytica]GAC12913.1 sec-independent protein translocase protein TatA [Aliiglaciecola lipolytica E3]